MKLALLTSRFEAKLHLKPSWTVYHTTLEAMDEDYLSSAFLVEGVLMLIVALMGVGLNTVSVFYFANLKHQRTFHRLLISLALMDNLHLVSY